MPVTAKLSKLFYDRLGEEIAAELVNWFNAVDATYRADLRDLNELNFARFDAKLEQRLTELDAKWSGRSAALDSKLEQRLTELDAKWGGHWAALDSKLEQRLTELDAKWGGHWAALDSKLERRTAALQQEMEARFARADAKLDQRTAELRQEIAQYTAAMRAELHALRGEMTTGFERVRADSANQRADLLKWMFLFWAPTALAVIGLYAKS